MSWRIVVVSKIAKLDLQMGSLVIRSDETVKVQVSEIAVLIIENTAVSLTAALLSKLVESKVKVIFCDATRNPQFELSPYYGAHDSTAKIRKQILWDNELKGVVWTLIVREKISVQRDLLYKLDKAEYQKLEGYISEIAYNDNTNREGHAAKVYFNSIFGLNFTREQENPINSCLNYGYSLLLSAVNREVVCCGFLTQLGIHHDNTFNYYNLSSDIMEPLRPIIDEIVVNLCPKKFEKEEKKELVSVFGSVCQIDGTEQHFLNAVRIYAKSVVDAMCDNDTTLIKFIER